MPPSLDYSAGRPQAGRRWVMALSLASVAVGAIAFVEDGVPRLTRAWQDVAHPAKRSSGLRIGMPLATSYLIVVVAVVAASALLVAAGLTSWRRPAIGLKLHAIYAAAMLPLAAMLGLLIAAFMLADPAAPPELAAMTFVVHACWFGAYPTLVLLLIYSKLRHFWASAVPAWIDVPILSEFRW